MMVSGASPIYAGIYQFMVAIGGIADVPRASRVYRGDAHDPTRTLRNSFFCDAQCYFFRIGLAFGRWPRSPHTDAFEEEAHGRLDALLHGLSRPRVA